MSELLGWYGYEKVDSGCTRGLNLDHFGRTNSRRANNRQREFAGFNDVTGNASSPIERSKGSSRSPISCQGCRSSPTGISVGSAKDNGSLSGVHRPSSRSSSLLTGPASPRVLDNSDSASDTPDGGTNCSWCGRVGSSWEPGNGSFSFTLTSNNSGRFCSEACFAAGRRAAFKRARTCDWCKHVRHSVSYVDFQDGESQLQFCSDKCLNQYKMNIFCRETQAHLALHGIPAGLPGLSSTSTASCAAGLITPELWLRDCRSASPRPSEENLVVDDNEEELRTDIPPREARCEQSFNKSEFSRNRGEKARAPRAFDEESRKIDAETEATRVELKEAIRESLLDEENRFRSVDESRRKENLDNCPGRLGEPEIDVIGSSSTSPPSSKDEEKRCEGIHVKDVKKLLACEPDSRNSPRQRRISSSWLGGERPPGPPRIENRSQRSQPRAPSSNFGAFHSPRTRNEAQSHENSSLLPPVTVLVPYPIPIPIPIPVPIPIPLIGKFFEDAKNPQESPLVSRQEESGLPEDLSKSRKMEECLERTAITENLMKSPSPIPSSSQSRRVDENVDAPVVDSRNSRPLRKRRRVNDNAEDNSNEIRIDKRRTKFVPV